MKHPWLDTWFLFASQLGCQCSSLISVATAIADVFRNNGISVGMNLSKILKIFGKIDEAKSRGVI
jgi:hypothetical protein